MEKQKRSRAAQESGAEGNCRQLIITLAVIYFRAYLILIGINTRFMQGTRPWRYNPELNFYSAFPLSTYLLYPLHSVRAQLHIVISSRTRSLS